MKGKASCISVVEVAQQIYVQPIEDNDLLEYFGESVASWSTLASDLGYTDPVAWHVRKGFTLKEHAPKAGPCKDQFAYLREWKSWSDTPTMDSVVFFIPRLLDGSCSKNRQDQTALMAGIRTRYNLPNHHLSRFGSAALLTGLVLAHFRRTKERTPVNSFWARTDTCNESNRRLYIGNFGDRGLSCQFWDDDQINRDIGVFPLGVETLEH